MLDNFLNVLLVNNMNGSKSYACCECGYEERDVNRNLRICPECGAFRAYGSDVLSFGDIQYAINSGMAIRNFNNKDLYRFISFNKLTKFIKDSIKEGKTLLEL